MAMTLKAVYDSMGNKQKNDWIHKESVTTGVSYAWSMERPQK